jgi:uncharacterized membrane protein
MRGGCLGLLASLMLVACGSDETPSAAVPPGQAPPDKGFRVCNRTGAPVEIAKAVRVATGDDPAEIVSEGWYQFADGECAFLWVGKLEHRQYLLYAQNRDVAREWKGDIPVCVSRQPFTLRQGSCEPGHDRRLFFQVDTGSHDLWTQTLLW